jgi:hypothetical protein
VRLTAVAMARRHARRPVGRSARAKHKAASEDAGGKWNLQEGGWELPSGQRVPVGLRKRIVSKVDVDSGTTIYE